MDVIIGWWLIVIGVAAAIAWLLLKIIDEKRNRGN